MSRGFITRPYQEEDEEQIVNLLSLCFDGWPSFDLGCSPLDHWRWKYKSNPAGESGIQVAVAEGTVVGVNHLLPRRIKLFDEVFNGIYAADVAVHPDFRGEGVSTVLREANIDAALEKGFKYVYYVTSNPHLIRSFERIRPRFPHQICNLVKIGDVDAQLKEMPVDRPLLMKWGYRGASFLNSLRNIASNVGAPANNEVTIQRVERFDEGIDRFCAAILSQHDYIMRRDVDFLNWRYCDPRAGDFIVNIAEDGDEVLGLLALRVNRYREDYPVGLIVELLVLEGRDDVYHLLISDALEYLEGMGVNIVVSQAVKNHPSERTLTAHGFVDSRIPLQIFCNPFGMAEYFSKFKDMSPSRVYYSYGDIDSLPASIPRYASKSR